MELTRNRIIAAVVVAVAIVVLVIFLVPSRGHGKITLTPCKGVETKYTNFELSACPKFEGDRCELTAGKSFTVKLDFQTPAPFDKASTYVEGNKDTQQLDACTVGAKCPSKAGDWQKLTWEVAISADPVDATELTVGVKNTVKDEFLFCYTMPARILPNKSGN